MPAEFFVDENDLALGKALDEQYGTVVYPGHSGLPSVPRGSLDDEWHPVVGRDRLAVITRDQRIRYRTVEKRLRKEHRGPRLRPHRTHQPVNRDQPPNPR